MDDDFQEEDFSDEEKEEEEKVPVAPKLNEAESLVTSDTKSYITSSQFNF